MKRYGRFIIILILVALLGGCAAKDMTLSNQGFQELSKANYEQAEKYLAEALYLNPDNPYALLNMGVVYQNTGRLDKARKMYEKVIFLRPKEKVKRASKDSVVGKPVVEIAAENLRLLERQIEAQKPEPIVTFKKPAQEAPSPLLNKEEPEPESMENLSEHTKTGEAKEGYYRVRKGDSLFKIASLQEVYNDALKWPSLFRMNLNMSSLGKMKVTQDFEHQELPEGLELKFVTPEEASVNLAKSGSKLWVVHVHSVLAASNIVPTAIRLMKNGYHVYITKANVKGKEWMRLRVGFYADRSEAAKIGKELMSLLNITKDPWIVNITKEEFNKFGGY